MKSMVERCGKWTVETGVMHLDILWVGIEFETWRKLRDEAVPYGHMR